MQPLPQSPAVFAATHVVTQYSPAMSLSDVSEDDPSTGQSKGDKTKQNKNTQDEDTKTAEVVDPKNDTLEAGGAKTLEDAKDSKTSEDAKDAGVKVDPNLLIPIQGL